MLFKHNSKKGPDKKQLKIILESQIYHECIFFKNPIVCYGQIQNYNFDESGLKITLNSVSTPGLEPPQESLLLSSNLEDLGISPSHLLSYEQGWHLFFKSELIEEIRRTAAENEYRDDKLLHIMDRLLNYLAQE